VAWMPPASALLCAQDGGLLREFAFERQFLKGSGGGLRYLGRDQTVNRRSNRLKDNHLDGQRAS
jgi:hypothetical protein